MVDTDTTAGTDTTAELGTWTHHRSRVANAVLRGDAGAADLARRDLRAARTADYIRVAVAAAPRFTPEQIELLRSLLPPVAPGVNTAAAQHKTPKARTRKASSSAQDGDSA